MAGNGEMVIDLDKKRMLAMGAKDNAALDGLLADDLVYTHSSARLDTKKSLIANMKSGATVYSAVESCEVRAQDLGDAVVLTGVARVKVSSNGRDLDFRVRFTDVGAGRWLPGSRPAFRTDDPTLGAMRLGLTAVYVRHPLEAPIERFRTAKTRSRSSFHLHGAWKADPQTGLGTPHNFILIRDDKDALTHGDPLRNSVRVGSSIWKIDHLPKVD